MIINIHFCASFQLLYFSFNYSVLVSNTLIIKRRVYTILLLCIYPRVSLQQVFNHSFNFNYLLPNQLRVRLKSFYLLLYFLLCIFQFILFCDKTFKLGFIQQHLLLVFFLLFFNSLKLYLIFPHIAGYLSLTFFKFHNLFF